MHSTSSRYSTCVTLLPNNMSCWSVNVDARAGSSSGSMQERMTFYGLAGKFRQLHDSSEEIVRLSGWALSEGGFDVLG